MIAVLGWAQGSIALITEGSNGRTEGTEASSLELISGHDESVWTPMMGYALPTSRSAPVVLYVSRLA